MFHKVISNNGKSKCEVEMGLSFFLNKRILFNDGVDKKTNDGRTTWIAQRNEKTIVFQNRMV